MHRITATQRTVSEALADADELVVELARGEQAWHPASTRSTPAIVLGPAVVTYRLVESEVHALVAYDRVDGPGEYDDAASCHCASCTAFAGGAR